MALRFLDRHKKNKYVVPTVLIESVRRLGTHEGGYVNDEVILYLIKHQQTLFALPELLSNVAFFGSFYVKNLKGDLCYLPFREEAYNLYGC